MAVLPMEWISPPKTEEVRHRNEGVANCKMAGTQTTSGPGSIAVLCLHHNDFYL